MSHSIRQAFIAISIVVFVGQSAGAGVVQYWKFDDGSGTTASNSADGGNTGVLVPGVTGPDWVSSPLAPELTSRSFMPSTFALDFTPNEYVDGGNLGLVSNGSGGAASVSMWIRPDTLTGDNRLFSQLTGPTNQAGASRFLSNGAAQIWSGSVWLSVGGAGSVSTGDWQHIAYVWDQDLVEVFVDGTSIGTTNANFEFGNLNGNFGIAARYINTHGTGFDGIIDEVSIWDMALSSEQITALAAGEAAIGPFIPEPSTFTLAGVVIVALVNRRRRRR